MIVTLFLKMIKDVLDHCSDFRVRYDGAAVFHYYRIGQYGI